MQSWPAWNRNDHGASETAVSDFRFSSVLRKNCGFGFGYSNRNNGTYVRVYDENLYLLKLQNSTKKLKNHLQ